MFCFFFLSQVVALVKSTKLTLSQSQHVFERQTRNPFFIYGLQHAFKLSKKKRKAILNHPQNSGKSLEISSFSYWRAELCKRSFIFYHYPLKGTHYALPACLENKAADQLALLLLSPLFSHSSSSLPLLPSIFSPLFPSLLFSSPLFSSLLFSSLLFSSLLL